MPKEYLEKLKTNLVLIVRLEYERMVPWVINIISEIVSCNRIFYLFKLGKVTYFLQS